MRHTEALPKERTSGIDNFELNGAIAQILASN
jgi:hypothetical protein